MGTMADTTFHDPSVELVPRASVPATEYAKSKAIWDKFKRQALGQLEPAIRASMVTTLDGLPYPVRFCNQGALDAWQQLFNAHGWSQRMWDTWATPRATCLDCINELCWHVDQRLHPHPLSQRSSDWPDTAFATVVRWAANIHFERKRGTLIETTPALDTLLMHSDIDDTLPMPLFSPPFGAQYLHLNRATAEHFRTAKDCVDQRWIDGIFCFVSKPSSSDDANKFIPVIELVIIYVAKDEHSDALKRLAAVGPKKQAKVQRRLESLYDRITVGPASAPAVPAAPRTADIRAPHWRRGYFRSQPCRPACNSRKLIFVAPILIYAERLSDQAPRPKAYELTTGRARPSRAAGRQQQTKQRIQPRERL